MPLRRPVPTLTIALLALLLAGCGSPEPQAVPSPGPARELPAVEVKLATIAAVTAEGVRGPGGHPFLVAERSSQLEQFPCQSCHQTPLAPPPPGELSARWMHMDIQLAHGPSMTCQTCHDYGQLQELNRRDLNEPITMDHSYRLCGQCHFQQLRDWGGGAHGKRLGGWRGERVILNCSGCHDPHAPAFAKRMPVQFPQIPRTATSTHWTD